MEFVVMVERAMKVRGRYAEMEKMSYGRAWTREEIALGFVGDVGDLVKLVAALEGVREIPEAKGKIAHELADCLWSVMVLAQSYDIDLEEAFLRSMDELEERIEASLRGGDEG